MVVYAMYLALGFCLAGLLALMALSPLRRRAERLTRARLEARLPRSYDDILAERSLLQAKYVIRERGLEQQLDAAGETRAQLMAESGRRAAEAIDLSEKLEVARTRVAALELSLSEATRSGAEKSTLLEATKAELGALSEAKDRLDREYRAACARLSAVEGQVKALESSLSEATRYGEEQSTLLVATKADLRALADRRAAEAIELSAKLEAAGTRVEALESSLSEATRSGAEKSTLLEATKAELRALSGAKDALDRDYAAACAGLKTFEARVAGLEASLSQATRSGAEASTLLEATKSEISALSQAKAGLDREFATAQARLRAFETRRDPEPPVLAAVEAPPSASVAAPAPNRGRSDWVERSAREQLSGAEAIAYLQHRAGRVDEAGASAVTAAIGRDPLALDLAAAVCRRAQMRFSAYASVVGILMGVAPRRGALPAGLVAAFDVAASEADKSVFGADALLAFIGFCAPEPIPLALLEGACDDALESLEALRALTDLSLVELTRFEDGAAAIAVDPRLRALALARAEETAGVGRIVGRLIARLRALYPLDGYANPQAWPLCARLTPHLVAVAETQTDFVADYPEARADLLVRAGGFFQGRGANDRAEALFTAALVIREAHFGPRHPETAASLNNLASLRCAKKDFSGARPLLERARSIFQEAVDRADPSTARRELDCAKMLLTVARPQNALALAEAALARLEVDDADPLAVEAAHLAADALEALGRRREARALRLRHDRRLSDRGTDKPAPGAMDGLILLWSQGVAPSEPRAGSR